MPSLLSIPREVRDIILDHALRLQKQQVPENPQTASERFPVPWSTLRLQLDAPEHISNSRTLQLINHQIRAETRELVRRYYKSPSYSIDMMMVDEMELWPTWLSIPAPSTRIDHINAQFRVFGGPQPEWRRRSAFQVSGGGNMPSIVVPFHHLMLIFLHCGPIVTRRRYRSDSRVSIKVLNLDFLTPRKLSALPPSEITMTDWMNARLHGIPAGLNDEALDYGMRPEWLAKYMSRYISAALLMTPRSAEFGQIMYERVGAINIHVDGRPYRQFDLAALLSGLDFEDREDHFGALTPEGWREQAVKLRRDAGLPIAQLEDDSR